MTAVSKAVVGSLLQDGWIEHCAAVGQYFKGRLEGLARKFDFIREVRGLGLILGLEMDRPGGPVVETCMKEGFLIRWWCSPT